MAEEKIVKEETKEEVKAKKAWKDTLPAKWAKVLASGGAAIGASAIVTVLLKQGNLDGIKGLKRLAIPLGIFGIATFASQSASKAVEKDIDDSLDDFETLTKMLFFVKDNKINKVSLTPGDEGNIAINIDGESK